MLRAPSKVTVVLVNGLGAGLEVGKSVQSDLERFAKVCSYDRAGEGHSDRIGHLQSPDEEQYNSIAAISPSLAQRYATQGGRFDRDEFLQSAGQLKPGEHLEWHLDLPLIVLEHKRLFGQARTEPKRYDLRLHEPQADLAARSKFGKLIETRSGHMIPTEEKRALPDPERVRLHKRPSYFRAFVI